jgi:hypothetical protein
MQVKKKRTGFGDRYEKESEQTFLQLYWLCCPEKGNQGKAGNAAAEASFDLPGVMIGVAVIQPVIEIIIEVALPGCADQKRKQETCEA